MVSRHFHLVSPLWCSLHMPILAALSSNPPAAEMMSRKKNVSKADGSGEVSETHTKRREVMEAAGFRGSFQFVFVPKKGTAFLQNMDGLNSMILSCSIHFYPLLLGHIRSFASTLCFRVIPVNDWLSASIRDGS